MGTGTVGGVFTPTLFLGAAFGALAAHFAQAGQPFLLTLIGLSVFLAAVTHSPWMAGFMSVELTGQWHILPLVLVLNFFAVAVARRISPRSLYGIATPDPNQTIDSSNQNANSFTKENRYEHFLSAQ